jgi:hypothetical protein
MGMEINGMRIIKRRQRAAMCFICALCLQNIKILVTPDGECIEIHTKDSIYPCTDDIKRDTGCWDDKGNTELCGASWIAIEEG